MTTPRGSWGIQTNISKDVCDTTCGESVRRILEKI